MKSTKQIFFEILVLLILGFPAFAQTKPAAKELSKMKTWQLLDYQKDSVYGTSVNRAYNELLKGKKSHPVIVAVIDGGVDITQEDLQGHIYGPIKKKLPAMELMMIKMAMWMMFMDGISLVVRMAK